MNTTNKQRCQAIYQYLDQCDTPDKDFINSLDNDDLQHWQSYFRQKAVLHESGLNAEHLKIDIAQNVMRQIENETSENETIVPAASVSAQAYRKSFWQRFGFTGWISSGVVVASAAGIIAVLLNSNNVVELNDSQTPAIAYNQTETTENINGELIADADELNDTANIEVLFTQDPDINLDKYYMMYGAYNSQASVTHQLAAYHHFLN